MHILKYATQINMQRLITQKTDIKERKFASVTVNMLQVKKKLWLNVTAVTDGMEYWGGYIDDDGGRFD